MDTKSRKDDTRMNDGNYKTLLKVAIKSGNPSCGPKVVYVEYDGEDIAIYKTDTTTITNQEFAAIKKHIEYQLYAPNLEIKSGIIVLNVAAVDEI